jgi:hypothetical protein
MESGAISQCANVHNLEVVQAIPEVLETGGISIHHFQLMATAAKILLHHFTRPFSRRDRMLSESNPARMQQLTESWMIVASAEVATRCLT